MIEHRKKIFFICFFLAIIILFVFLDIVVGPLILALIGAYLLNPPIEYLEKKGLKRSYTAFLVLVTFFIAVFFAIWFLFPVLFSQIEMLIKLFPEFKMYMENELFPEIQKFTGNITGQKSYQILHVSDILPINIADSLSAILVHIVDSTRFFVSVLITLLLTPLFAFFLMRDYKKIYKMIFSFVPQDIKPVFLEFVLGVDKKLRSVLRGQSLVVLILCVLYPSAFFIAGLPTAITVGLLTGVARFIPYMDLVMGSFLCFFVLVTKESDGNLILSVTLAFLTVQCLDGLFITPRIMGKFSGLPPFLVILSVLCFGDWIGFYGVLLAIPLAAIGRVSFKMLLRSYRESHFFNYDSH